MVRTLSFSSYFLLKKPEKMDFLAVVSVLIGAVFTAGASDTDLTVALEAVFDFVDLVVLDFADDFGFLVAIIPPLTNIYSIIAQNLCYNGKNNLFRKNMGIVVNKEDNKDNELEQRISADLRARAVAEAPDGEVTDFENDSEYIKETKKTGRFAWVWVVLIVLAIVSLVIIFMPASRG